MTRAIFTVLSKSRAQVSPRHNLRRMYSEQPSQQTAKKVSPHIGFYKSFGRPLAKVFLISIAVYQITYWAWVKLETDEVKRDKTAEIERLEQELKELANIKS